MVVCLRDICSYVTSTIFDCQYTDDVILLALRCMHSMILFVCVYILYTRDLQFSFESNHESNQGVVITCSTPISTGVT